MRNMREPYYLVKTQAFTIEMCGKKTHAMFLVTHINNIVENCGKPEICIGSFLYGTWLTKCLFR